MPPKPKAGEGGGGMSGVKPGMEQLIPIINRLQDIFRCEERPPPRCLSLCLPSPPPPPPPPSLSLCLPACLSAYPSVPLSLCPCLP
eukprot:COSAG02_NODE_3410_length_6788_cov_20.669009_1_plen_85_part_10